MTCQEREREREKEREREREIGREKERERERERERARERERWEREVERVTRRSNSGDAWKMNRKLTVKVFYRLLGTDPSLKSRVVSNMQIVSHYILFALDDVT
jgi:hypothetical protein